MPLQNAFGDLALDATLQAVLVELGQKLEAGQEVSLSAATLAALESITAAVTGTVALDAPTLTALENVQTTGNTSLASIELNTDNRYAGGKTAVVATVTDTGDTIIHTPAAGNALRLYWLSAISDPDGSSNPLIRVGFGAASITAEKYRAFATSHWEVFEGAADESLIVNLSKNGSVAFTAHIEEFTP